MLRELKVVEQRYQAVLQVLDGIPVTEVAERFGVVRQTVHRWVARYRDSGIEGLADRSHAPKSHPWRISAEVEAVIRDLRGSHRRWGPRRLVFELGKRGHPVSQSTVYRVLVRHQLLQPGAAAQAPGPVPPLGAFGGDGTVADGRHGQPVPGRWPRVQDHHRD
jgi:transposase